MSVIFKTKDIRLLQLAFEDSDMISFVRVVVFDETTLFTFTRNVIFDISNTIVFELQSDSKQVSHLL